MSKILIWVSRIAAWLCAIYPLVYLTNKFTTVQVTEATTNNVLPIPILILISVLGLVIIIALSTQLLILYINKIKGNPFSFIILAPFILVMLGISWFARVWLHKVDLLIKTNVTQFSNDISTYSHAIGVIMIWWLVAILIGSAGEIYNYIEQKKA